VYNGFNDGFGFIYAFFPWHTQKFFWFIYTFIDEGLKHDNSIHCDELVSLPKSVLTNFIGTLSPQKIRELNQALRIALDIPN